MTESAKQHSIIYARFMVAILLLAQILAYVDRQVVAIVVDPMKQDLSLTDTQVGWLYGVFAIFYALAGIPIARLADRKKRTNLIALGVLIWSAMTMFSGVAKNFWQILIARTGVGSAEAALVPAGTSLITDLFPPERVPLAVSVFNSGSVFGSGLAFVIGGTVLALIGESGEPLLPILSGLSTWQQFFIYCGAPGLLLVPVFLVVREPARAILRSGQAAAPVSDVLDFYRENRRLMVAHHLGFLAFSLLGFG
ncbi:MAG: MFS transporter, partial [Betaproteobacteria bacterium]